MRARSNQLRPIAIALLPGAITTIAIAWAAMFIPHGGHGYGPPVFDDLGIVLDDSSEYPRYVQVSEGRNAWHHVVTYWWMQMSGQSLWIPLEDYEARKLDLDELPDHLRPDSFADFVMMSWYRETGWPMKAMTCAVHWREQVQNDDIIYRVAGGLQLPRDKDFEPRALPLTPLWPGFAANTVLYSTLWFAMFWCARASRTFHRARQNRCIHCGYLRIGLAAEAKCPECGQSK